MVECFVLLYFFVIVGNTSIQLASPSSKTGFIGRTPILQLNFSVKTAPVDVFLEQFSLLLTFKSLVNSFFYKFCFNQFWLSLGGRGNFIKELVID